MNALLLRKPFEVDFSLYCLWPFVKNTIICKKTCFLHQMGHRFEIGHKGSRNQKKIKWGFKNGWFDLNSTSLNKLAKLYKMHKLGRPVWLGSKGTPPLKKNVFFRVIRATRVIRVTSNHWHPRHPCFGTTWDQLAPPDTVLLPTVYYSL